MIYRGFWLTVLAAVNLIIASSSLSSEDAPDRVVQAMTLAHKTDRVNRLFFDLYLKYRGNLLVLADVLVRGGYTCWRTRAPRSDGKIAVHCDLLLCRSHGDFEMAYQIVEMDADDDLELGAGVYLFEEPCASNHDIKEWRQREEAALPEGWMIQRP